MANSVTFTTNKIDGAISSEPRYQAKINSAGVISTETLAAEVAANLKEPAAFIEGSIKEISRVTAAHLAKGERVLLDGLCHIELYTEGPFETEDAAWDPSVNRIVARAIPYDIIKTAAADIVPTNTLSKVSIQLLGEQDASTKEQSTLTIGNTAVFQGKNIQVTVANADEGFYLLKGERSIKGTIVNNTAGTADVTFGTLTAQDAGEDWTCEVRGRAGLGTNRSLVTARITGITIKANA